MKYLCLICAEKVMEPMPEAEADQHYEEYREFPQDIRQGGYYVDCNRLLPADSATTIRVRNGKLTVTDGPFAETKEQLGGYYNITVDNCVVLCRACHLNAHQGGRWADISIYEDLAKLQMSHKIAKIAALYPHYRG